jgi:predicted kinase
MTTQQKIELTKLIERARYRSRAEDRDELVANLEWAIAEIEALQAALNERVGRPADATYEVLA